MPTRSGTKKETQGRDYLQGLVDAFVSSLDYDKHVYRITSVCRS